MATILTESTSYPCAILQGVPPATDDALSAIATDAALTQTLALTPRGPAWGNDEAGDGSGASPVLRGWWRAMSGVLADGMRSVFVTAMQAFPSGIAWSLEDWERELGLPEECFAGGASIPQRIDAVRLKHMAFGAASPGYFICLAASIGYTITIEEPDAFMCDDSECDGPEQTTEIDIGQYWIVNVAGLQETWFIADEGEADDTPLEGYVQQTLLECALRRQAPVHTTLIFNYTP